MASWRWLGEAAILAAHDEQLAEHGGSGGLRDRGLLQSTLARARNRAAYARADAAALAAAYAFGMVRNHPFIDGNKRMALLAAEAFLLENGLELTASDAETLQKVLDLAEGGLTEAAFAAWIRANIAAAR